MRGLWGLGTGVYQKNSAFSPFPPLRVSEFGVYSQMNRRNLRDMRITMIRSLNAEIAADKHVLYPQICVSVKEREPRRGFNMV